MATTDRWGCPLTGSDDDEQLVGDTIEAYVRMSPATADLMGGLGESAPFGRCVLAQLLIQSHRPELVSRAAGIAGELLLHRFALSPRERGHVDALVAWVSGDVKSAIDRFGEVLNDHPTDLLALRAQHLLLFNDGQIERMLAVIQRVRPAWEGGLPLESFLDGMESFAREEGGSMAAAEECGTRGAQADPTDLWAIHAVAHVLETEERRRDGIEWLTGRDDVFAGGGRFTGHLWWHRALHHLELGETDEVLRLHDEGVYPDASEEGLDITNSAALLTRLEVADADVGTRWGELAGPAAVRIGQHSHVFNDVHYSFALVKAGRAEESAELRAGMRTWSRRDDTGGAVLGIVGVALADGVAAWAAGDYDTAADLIDPVRHEIWRIGGSNAQRDVFAQILESAAERSGRIGRARELLAERIVSCPLSVPSWRRYERILRAAGDTAAADHAKERISQLSTA
ncbi:MAG: tetratricopeptide repeat protein [Actinomycetia bacterium]|nr:tetratricopeptide repeat protein [Actinomycetes bacterium]